MRTQLENGWELNNGNYYKWDGDKLLGSLQGHDENDGVHPNVWGVQIHPPGGGIVVIGYIAEDVFAAVLAQAICDAALRENQTYEWWTQYKRTWWLYNAVAQ